MKKFIKFVPEKAFTIIELIGVMAILAIIFATAAPGLIGLIKNQKNTEEKKIIRKIAESLEQGILKNKEFPKVIIDESLQNIDDREDWYAVASNNGAGSLQEVEYPYGNNIQKRMLYYGNNGYLENKKFTDPDMVFDENDDFRTNFRIILLSTLNEDLVLPDFLSESLFDQLWENDLNDLDLATYSAFDSGTTSWAGRSDELNLIRIDLRGWLCELEIENRWAIQQSGQNILGKNLFTSIENESSPDHFPLNLDEQFEFVQIKFGNAFNFVPEFQYTNGSSPYFVVIENPVAKLPETISDLTIEVTYLIQDGAQGKSGTFNFGQLGFSQNNRNENISILGGTTLNLNSNPIQKKIVLKNLTLLLKNLNGDILNYFIVEKPYSYVRFDGQKWNF